MSVQALSLVRRVADYYAAERGWSDQEAADTIYLASHAVAQYPDHHPESGRDGVRVYVIADPGGSVKIGISNNPEVRLHALQAGNPNLKLVHQSEPFSRAYAMAVEAAAHDHLAARSLGREWFDCSYEKAVETIHLFGGIVE